MQLRSGCILALSILSSAALADDWRLLVQYGDTQPIFGSVDERVVYSIGLEREHGTHPRLRWGSRRPSVVLTGLVSRNEGPRNNVWSMAAFMTARYRNKTSWFFEAGVGLSQRSGETRDISCRFNVLTHISVGRDLGSALVGVRLTHLSNAFWGPPNKGENELSLMIAVPI